MQLLGHKGGEFIFRIKQIVKIKTTSSTDEKNGDNLNKIVASLYENLRKREDAENENKPGTVKRIQQELNFVNNILQKELIRELEDGKTKLLDKGGLESVLPKEFLKRRDELLKLKEEKNTVVKQQKYTEAAKIRDKEKDLVAVILKENVKTFDKIFETVELKGASIIKDYFILTIALDFIPFKEASDYKAELEKLFCDLLFNEISKRDNHISEFKYRAQFDDLHEKINKIISGIKSNSH